MSDAIDMSKLAIHKHKFNILASGLAFVHLGSGGGTGGQLSANILKLMGALPSATADHIYYFGIDGDTFEPKNLGRQMCINADMGKNKAEVIVSRYAKAYGVNPQHAKFIDSYITTDQQIDEILSSLPYYTVVFIDTVDKNLPRKLIHDAIIRAKNQGRRMPFYTISCGNGEWTGQVVLGAKGVPSGSHTFSPVQSGISILSDPYCFEMPTAFDLFPELIDLEADKKEEALSCADRAVANAQNLIANNVGSTIALNYVAAMIQEYKCMDELMTKNNNSFDIRNYKPSAPQTIGCVRYNALTNYYENSQLTSSYLIDRKVGD